MDGSGIIYFLFLFFFFHFVLFMCVPSSLDFASASGVEPVGYLPGLIKGHQKFGSCAAW